MRDASLDEFLSGTDEETEEDDRTGERDIDGVEAESGPDPEPESEDAQASDADFDADTEADTEPEAGGLPRVAAVEPARSTFAWSPGGATCAACGERVEERWESEAGLVCGECKAW